MAKFKNCDEYINQTQEFAKPLLAFFRECVLETCPEAKVEIKWNFPNFIYNGSILCHMAGFKQHVTFGFWLGAQMKDSHQIMNRTGKTGMGNFGKISSLNELPDREILIEYIKEAMLLSDEGMTLSSQSAPKKKANPLAVPEILKEALKKNLASSKTFYDFSQSAQNDYSEWIDEAKTETTKLKRLNQTLEWLEEGKPRNWKYMKKWQN